jgi:hypothetical protein
MTDEQKHAVEQAQKVLRAVKLYDLAANLAAPTILYSADDGESIRPVAWIAPAGNYCTRDPKIAAQIENLTPVYATRDAAPIVDAITDERIMQIFYPMGTATDNQKLIAIAVGRALLAASQEKTS